MDEALVEIDGEGFYAVPGVDQMPPFLMSVVSDGDRWMFVSSSGALTAGRADTSGALFPYETDDRLHQGAGLVGPVTAIRVPSAANGATWSPFRRGPLPKARRCLYKSVVGDSVIFEEVHSELQLRFRYRWASSDQFGFVRTATLVNDGDQPVRAEVIDGLLNVLPYGLDPSVYQSLSNLTNAYKRSEIIDTPSRLAVFSLETRVADRPEPAEVLRGSVVWSIGLDDASVTVSPDALAAFEAGQLDDNVSLLTGRPGAYLLRGTVDLAPGGEASWQIVSDVAQDQIAVANLRTLLRSQTDVRAAITASIREATESLVEMMAPADALQRTGDRIATAHQFSNVTYNVMRGGVPITGYRIRTSDFTGFVHDRNRQVADRHRTWFEALPATIEREALLGQIGSTGDVHLTRLGLEYLPFGFSRRHGDPSRPWNAFSIRVRNESGEPAIYYEGNWRDIFQNWEALCMSFPEYLPGVISVFVNASTPDGFNPYRITRNGIDWEVPDPDDPWSNIGYWGDHQIVYLLRLLEAAERYLPGRVRKLLSERWFTYSDVPYRLAPYDALVHDPKATIRYDESAASQSADRVDKVGSDGKLLWSEDGELYLVTLFEKLLVPALTKLSNFVPGGGIWMNTQRPEWNDANNALVGFGLSMVTLNHLRAYLVHFRTLIATNDLGEVAISTEVAGWLSAVISTFRKYDSRANEVTDQSRKDLMDELGQAFSDYRARVYASGFSGLVPVSLNAVIELCDTAIEHLDETIRNSRRTDGLYHSYNLVRFSSDGSAASVEHLHEMLEGQVAILSSGLLSSDDQADLVDALFSSDMYRADQRSFLLYPARHLPSFLDKNVVPAEAVENNPLLAGLLGAGDSSVVAVDVDGLYRFNADFANRDNLEATLDRLAGDQTWNSLVAAHRGATQQTYEKVFRHHAFTGRSGSMYGYEGIGSIYWHMVAKLLLAVQESVLNAVTQGASPATVERLIDAYWRVRSGLGFNKTAAEFGAISIDPYSHTPAHAGAQQPGMTGLVKEELLTRPLELGVRVNNGEIWFDPVLLRRTELLEGKEQWTVYDLDLEQSVIQLGKSSLGMTLCQVPVVVSVTSGDAHVEVFFADGTTRPQPGLVVDRENSAEVFARSGEITRIHAHVPEAASTAKTQEA
jgi:hypothetical protein